MQVLLSTLHCTRLLQNVLEKYEEIVEILQLQLDWNLRPLKSEKNDYSNIESISSVLSKDLDWDITIYSRDKLTLFKKRLAFRTLLVIKRLRESSQEVKYYKLKL